VTTAEAKRLRKRLRRDVGRARSLAARCVDQTCDGDLPWKDRTHAQAQAAGALLAAKELERTLDALEEAMRDA
jgi:hypothetical protein